MPACLSRSLGFAAMSSDYLSSRDDHTTQSIISSISNPPSLRRTLSADMASEKWTSDLKKVASLENLNYNDDEDHNGGEGFGSGSGSGAFEDVWSSIQREQGKNTEEAEKPRSQTDIWSSILSQKAVNERDANNSGADLPPPYVHPLVKRSASSLSEKSLEICTESLGSETGSDCFLPEPASDSDPEESREVVAEEVKEVAEPMAVVMKVKAVASGAPVRSFPPPLPSLGHRGDGSSNVQMRSHRRDGRLVLEAVTVPTNNCFKAERQDGRLLLTFSGRHVLGSENTDVDMVENGSTGEDEDEDEEVWEDGTATEDAELEEGDDLACDHKFLGLTRNLAGWPRRLNKAVYALDQPTETALARSVPIRAHGLNPYVYSWRSEPGSGLNEAVAEGKKAGKVEEDVFLKACNLLQPKRSVLLWEPRCIAT